LEDLKKVNLEYLILSRRRGISGQILRDYQSLVADFYYLSMIMVFSPY